MRIFERATGVFSLRNCKCHVGGVLLFFTSILLSGPSTAANPANIQSESTSADESHANMTKIESKGESSKPEPGSRFQDCPNCPEMIVLPPGSFMMGSPDTEAGRQPTEGPIHAVTYEKSFAIGVYEVTFAQWDACVNSGGCDDYRPKRRFFLRNWGHPRQPVMRIEWDDISSYLSWLTNSSGKPYRLPSEAEWEYAVRGGTTTPFHTGDTISQTDANFGRYFVGRPDSVGSYPANPFGLHDMLGNVAEWCEDCWHANYVGAPTDGSAWLTGNCDRRVLRGGHWASDAEAMHTSSTPRALRAASRGTGPALTKIRKFLNTGKRDVTIGFRVARDL